jgi:hypothetical protein
MENVKMRNVFPDNLLLRIFPEFYGEFVEAKESAFSTGGKLGGDEKNAGKSLKLNFNSESFPGEMRESLKGFVHLHSDIHSDLLLYQ